MRRWLVVTLLSAISFACGKARPDPSDYRTKPDSVVQTETDNNDDLTGIDPAVDPSDEDTNNADVAKETPPDTQPPGAVAPTPVVPKAAIRTLANPTEIANARTAYGTDCAGCHMALATSAKKAVTLVRLNAAGVAGTVAAHNALINAAKWPADVKDATDDGIDTAVLKASAFVEALK
ncbi:MAG TPA: hypothetical protein VE954_41845 [Oligoflexus sp.]|uniref:hypothetical protein n=1 Tax=Oligoflexus sp. TaxID=1971216 RepID=UPI002D70E488|nr:hypothetical protein [Oligoflexus sp.]HYX39686.1 hypothetical protein [Oligoflexus sp.]